MRITGRVFVTFRIVFKPQPGCLVTWTLSVATRSNDASKSTDLYKLYSKWQALLIQMRSEVHPGYLKLFLPIAWWSDTHFQKRHTKVKIGLTPWKSARKIRRWLISYFWMISNSDKVMSLMLTLWERWEIRNSYHEYKSCKYRQILTFAELQIIFNLLLLRKSITSLLLLCLK